MAAFELYSSHFRCTVQDLAHSTFKYRPPDTRTHAESQERFPIFSKRRHTRHRQQPCVRDAMPKVQVIFVGDTLINHLFCCEGTEISEERVQRYTTDAHSPTRRERFNLAGPSPLRKCCPLEQDCENIKGAHKVVLAEALREVASVCFQVNSFVTYIE